MRRLVGVLVATVVLLSILSPVFPAVAAAGAAGNTDTTTPTTGSAGAAGGADTGGNWSYEELSDRGMQIEGQDPSSRYLGGDGMVFVSYRETNFVKELSSLDEPEWAIDKVVTPGQPVDTQEVTMHVSRFKNAPSETVNVHIVQYDTKEIEVTEGNTTRTETVAVNQTHRVVEAQLTGGGDTFRVDLPHTDDQKMVAMWIEEYPDARWVFAHDPVATANALPFGNSWASFLPWFFTRFLGLVAIGVPLAIGGAIKTLEKTGSGPGKGAAWWLIVPGILGYIASYMALGKIAGLIVTMPWVMGILVVVIAYLATLEYADQTYKLVVEQISTTGDINALGEEVSDIEGEQGATFHAVDLDKSRIALVKKGSLKKFILVALTDASWPVLDLSDMKCRIEYEKGSREGNKVADAKLYADEAEDEVLSVKWPELSVGLSNLKVSRDELPGGNVPAVADGEEPPTAVGNEWSKDKVSSAFAAWSFGTIVGAAWLGPGAKAAAIGLIPAAKTASDVTDSWARFVPAPEHATKAKASRVAEKHELSVAKTFEEMQQSEADREADLAEVAIDIADSRTEQSRKRLRRLLGLEGTDAFATGAAAGGTASSEAAAATDGGQPSGGED
jgi:hypothetical protein